MLTQATELLVELSDAFGPSGYEDEVREIVARRLKGYGTFTQDRLGSVVCKKEGVDGGPRIMLPGHMDEIGMIVRSVDKEGFIRMVPVGGWWEHVLLGQTMRVRTRKGDCLGVIGAKPPHVLKPDERNKVMELKDLHLDVGATSKKDTEQTLGVRIGDPMVPETKAQVVGARKVLMGKAWDDRVGCAMLIEVLRRLARKKHPNVVYGVGTVQEEIGLKGATTAAHVIDPDVCLTLDVGVADDTPGGDREGSAAVMGKGVQIMVRDGGMIPSIRLRDFMIDVAEKDRIPHQVSLLPGGTTDGRAVQVHGRGVATIYIGIPTRYVHSHSGLIHLDDFESAVLLILGAIKRLDKKTVASLG